MGSPTARYRCPVSSQRVPGGVVYTLPADLREALIANSAALGAWKDGHLDSTFGQGGLARADLGGTTTGGVGLVAQPDGGLVVGGGTDATGTPDAPPVRPKRALRGWYRHARVRAGTWNSSCAPFDLDRLPASQRAGHEG